MSLPVPAWVLYAGLAYPALIYEVVTEPAYLPYSDEEFRLASFLQPKSLHNSYRNLGLYSCCGARLAA